MGSDIPNFPFGLAGTIDCDEGGVIWDWKTAKASPTADVADLSEQITMYSLAKATLDKEIPVARLGYVVKLKKPKTMVLETRRTRNDFSPLLRALERIAEAIDKEVFPFASMTSPRPWCCSPKWCGYYATCEGVSCRTQVFAGE